MCQGRGQILASTPAAAQRPHRGSWHPPRVTAPTEGHSTCSGSWRVGRLPPCFRPAVPLRRGFGGLNDRGSAPHRRDGGRTAWGAGPPQRGLRAGSPAPSVLLAHLLQRGLRAEILPSQKLTACVRACLRQLPGRAGRGRCGNRHHRPFQLRLTDGTHARRLVKQPLGRGES